jgi:putative heme-binding domain-containing protein
MKMMKWIPLLGAIALLSAVQVQSKSEAEQLDVIVTAVSGSNDPAVQANVLKGLLAGLSGRRDITPPADWSALNARLSASPNAELRKLVQQLSQVFGDVAAGDAALTTLRDAKADPAARREALKALLTQRHAELFSALEALLDQSLRIEAIRAYGTFDQPAVPELLLKRYPTFDAAGQRAVIETLATRKSFARPLLEAMKSGSVKKTDVPAYVARSLNSLLGEDFVKVYGDVRAQAEDKEKQIAEYKKRLASDAFASADASRGRAVYQQTCASCHKLYDDGGLIGPELTGSNRADQDYILLNIIDPSYDVPEGYRMVIVTTKDGQTLIGTIAEEDPNKLVLRMVGQEQTIAKTDIKSREVSTYSMMPEALLATLSPQQFLDLIKYLQTEQQVALP